MEATSNMNKNMSIREEYICVTRTRSYEHVWDEVHNHHRTTTRSPPATTWNYTRLLDPDQEALRSTIQSSGHRRPAVLLEYFDATFGACNFCGTLVDAIERARTNCRVVRKALAIDGCDPSVLVANLRHLAGLPNPFRCSTRLHFRTVHAAYGSMVMRLTTAHRKAARKQRYCSLATKVASSVMCGMSIVTAKGTAMRVEAQLDAATRGAYALSQDFDTMSCMMTRLGDEIEHQRELIMLLTREEFMLKEVTRELQASFGCFMDRLEEMEEHLCLCFLNINRVRRMVLPDMNIAHRRQI